MVSAPITGEHAVASVTPQRQLLREKQIYHVLDRTLAVVQIVFGVGTLLGIVVGVFADPANWRPLETMLGFR